MLAGVAALPDGDAVRVQAGVHARRAAVAVPERARSGGEISAITHDDERAVTACAAYNEIAAALVAGLAPGASVAGRAGDRA